MGKAKIYCVVCDGPLVAQNIIIEEGDEGEADIEELNGFTCADCGLHYDKLPRAKVVKLKKWEKRVIDDMGGGVD